MVTAGTASGPTVAILAGAAGGAAGALTGSLLNGANIGQIAKATFTGAFWGAASGYLNCISADEDLVASLFKHSFTQGGMDALQGGNMLHGFMMGAISSSGGYLINENAKSLGRIGEVAANSILSGTVEEIGGGKFANGAITGAFAILFNDMMHHHFSDKMLKKIYDAYTHGSFDNGKWMNPEQLCLKIGGEIGELAGSIKNACAIRLSYAMNKAGIKIPHVNGTMMGADGKYYFLKASVMAQYLKKWRVCTVRIGNHAINGIVFQYPNADWNSKNISGHVDVVYKRKWGSYYQYSDYNGNAPYNNHVTEIFH